MVAFPPWNGPPFQQNQANGSLKIRCSQSNGIPNSEVRKTLKPYTQKLLVATDVTLTGPAPTNCHDARSRESAGEGPPN